jgi:hypothetical protein
MPCGAQDLERGLGVGQLQLDLLVVERALAQALAHHLARGVVGRRRRPQGPRCASRRSGRRHQHVEDAVLGGVLGAARLQAHLALALLLDGHVTRSRTMVSTSLPT